MSDAQIIILAIGIPLLIFNTYAFYKVGKKLGNDESYWFYLIPFYNVWLLIRAIGGGAGLMVLILVPYINIIAWCYLVGQIAKKLGKNEWLYGVPSIIMLLPIPLWILVFDDSKMLGKREANKRILSESYKKTNIAKINSIVIMSTIMGVFTAWNRGINGNIVITVLATFIIPLILYNIYYFYKNKGVSYTEDIQSSDEYREEPQTTPIKLKATNPQFPTIKVTQSQSVTLGRDRGNDIIINNRYLSSSHIEIELIDGSVYITDKGSTNGSYIDGDKLESYQPMELREGESLVLGSEEVVYEL